MDKVFITGGSGFIGTNLVQYFLDRDMTVLNYDIRPPRNKLHADYWYRADILDRNALLKVVQDFNPDYIFHMAARTDLGGVHIDDYAANIQGVSNVVEAAKGVTDLKRVVFTSSMLVCKLGYQPSNELDYMPSTLYGESKVAGEKIVREEAGDAFTWLIVRPTSIWGPWFDVPYKKFFTAVMKGYYFHPKGLKVMRSYGFVLNAIHELAMLATCSKEMVHSRAFYLADYVPIELRTWGELIQKAFNSRTITDVPVAVFVVAARLGDILKRLGYSDPPMSTFRFSNMRTNAVFEMEGVKKLCGELPYSTSEGVELTVDWMKQHSA
jgi:nucleoside-diphosphate-sugar epimerase